MTAAAPFRATSFATLTEGTTGMTLIAVFYPSFHEPGRITRAGRHDAYFFFLDDFGDLARKGAHEHDIDAEGLFVSVFAFLISPRR
jgi:hypothetical protein